MKDMETFIITKIKDNTKEIIEDLVAEEVPFTLNLAKKEFVTLLCSPFDLEDLVRGFLFTSGLIKKADEIKNIVLNEQQWVAYIELANGVECGDLLFKRLYTSGCGRGTLFYNAVDIMHRLKITSDFKIRSDYTIALMADFQKRSQIYFKTGGVHSAALADEKSILIFREDIGRHNAIDKVIGHAVLANNTFENKILLTSGRISSEVLFKVKKCGVPIVISRSAPTNQGIRLSKDFGITLVGFARGNRMNVYSGEKRII
ncbi:MAG: formate dehydrogenase accessory sulfurtransferase FdhD [Planctomycetota bacterium]